MLNELRETIRKGEQPKYTFSDFITEYSAYAEKRVIGENTERAIQLQSGSVTASADGEVNKWHITPSAGKYGKSVTVIKDSGRQYDFGPDTAALYKHHVFVYETSHSIIMVFHRQSGSGCKSVFLETANKFLKSKGLKLEMEVILPLIDEIKDAIPTKLILRAKRKNDSSDIADCIGTTKEKDVVIRELSLNLKVSENRKVLGIWRDYQLRKLTKDDAFPQILATVDNGVEYNDVVVGLKIGSRVRKIRWEELERVIGAYDITDQLRGINVRTQAYLEKLKQLSDGYYEKIIGLVEV